MNNHDVQSIVEDATLDFTLGDNKSAIKKLDEAINVNSQSFEAWHALAEIYFSDKFYDRALHAAKKAYKLKPKDIDYVAPNIFSNATQLIRMLKPNIYCKGKDYKNFSFDVKPSFF